VYTSEGLAKLKSVFIVMH